MVDKQKVWETIYDELQGKEPLLKIEISDLVSGYIDTLNSARLDRALVMCSMNGVSPPRTLVHYLAEVAAQRLSGIKSPSQSQSKKLQKEYDRSAAYLWAFKLIYACGFVKSEAIDYACAALDRERPNSNLVNSSFEKNYDIWVRKNKWIEDVKKILSEWTPEQKKEFIDFFPVYLPKALRGTRR